jgi:hypothetical protein
MTLGFVRRVYGSGACWKLWRRLSCTLYEKSGFWLVAIGIAWLASLGALFDFFSTVRQQTPVLQEKISALRVESEQLRFAHHVLFQGKATQTISSRDSVRSMHEHIWAASKKTDVLILSVVVNEGAESASQAGHTRITVNVVDEYSKIKAFLSNILQHCLGCAVYSLYLQPEAGRQTRATVSLRVGLSFASSWTN